MKKFVCVISACLVLAGCEKYESGPITQDQPLKRPLSGSEMLLKTNLDQAAQILADVIRDEAVMNELAALSKEDREFYNLSFSDLMDESKSLSASFRNLREGFTRACSSSETKGNTPDLAGFLAKNDCYIYCPYPSNFYPKGNSSFTIAAHPIDNDIENTGYRYEGRKVIKVKVNEEYADKNMVLLIMPRDEDDGALKVNLDNALPGSKGNPIYEIKVGKVRCADYCGGLFEGTLELRVGRGYPEYNIETNELKGKFSAVIPIDYPRSYAKAAIRGYEIHSEGGWYNVNVIWDSDWETTDIKEGIITYEYDHVVELSVGLTVGYKKDTLSSSLSTTAKTTYRGEILGLNEWKRDWFFATNSNPGPDDEVKDGWVIRTTNPVFQLITPLRTISF